MSMREARALVKTLRATGATAPEGLADVVMTEIGLADPWTEIEGPIGPVYVAWGSAGITQIERHALTASYLKWIVGSQLGSFALASLLMGLAVI